MAVSQDFMTWTCGPELDPEYLLIALRALQPELRRLMYGSTHKTIYMPDLHALRIPMPPLPDQRKIVQVASAESARLWPLVDEFHVMKLGLEEYRRALITDAVSGRLSVLAPAEAGREELANSIHTSSVPAPLS